MVATSVYILYTYVYVTTVLAKFETWHVIQISKNILDPVLSVTPSTFVQF